MSDFIPLDFDQYTPEEYAEQVRAQMIELCKNTDELSEASKLVKISELKTANILVTNDITLITFSDRVAISSNNRNKVLIPRQLDENNMSSVGVFLVDKDDLPKDSVQKLLDMLRNKVEETE